MADLQAAHRWRTLFILAVAVAVADQATKAFVRAHVSPGDALVVIPGFFDVVHGQNTGVVFGLFPGAPGLLRALHLLTVPLLVWGYAALPLTRGGRLAWAAIVGGATGNLIDRLARGSVTDFIDWYLGSYHWYTFNVADACITTGVLAIVGLNLFSSPPSGDAATDVSHPA